MTDLATELAQAAGLHTPVPSRLDPALIYSARLRPGDPLGLAFLDDGALKLGHAAH